MAIASQLPWALWPVGKVNKIHSNDGGIRLADVGIEGHVCTKLVLQLVILLALPIGEQNILRDFWNS